MRWTLGFVFTLTLAILAVNANPKLTEDVIERNIRSEPDTSRYQFESESLINSESLRSSKTKTKLIKKPVFSKNPRETREALIKSSKLLIGTENIFENDSLLRKKRTAEEDTNESISTTESPLENDASLSSSATTSAENEDEKLIEKDINTSILMTTETPITMAKPITDANNDESTLHSDESNPTDKFTALLSSYKETSIPKSSMESENIADLINITDAPVNVTANSSLENVSDLDDIEEVLIENSAATGKDTVDSANAKTESKESIEKTKEEDNTEARLPHLESAIDAERDSPTDTNANNTSDTITITKTETDETPSADNDDLMDVSLPSNDNDKSTDADELDDTTDVIQPEEVDEVTNSNNVTDVEINENEETTDSTSYMTTDLTANIVTEENPESETTAITNFVDKWIDNKNAFRIYDDDGNFCIIAYLTATVQITYDTVDGKTVTKRVHVPTDTPLNGSCGVNLADVTFGWVAGSSDRDYNLLTLRLAKDSHYFYVDKVEVFIVLDEENFPDAADKVLQDNSTNLRLFSASRKTGAHYCHHQTDIYCGKVNVQIKDIFLIAFVDEHSSISERQVEECLPPRSISIAAIVGGVVGITIITVGIVASYIWYRKRTSTFRSELP